MILQRKEDSISEPEDTWADIIFDIVLAGAVLAALIYTLLK